MSSIFDFSYMQYPTTNIVNNDIKFNNKSKNYGLTFIDLQDVRTKIIKQRKFLLENEFVTANGEFKTLLDVSMAANHSERYYAMILNKVNTFVSYNLNRDLVPVFMTVTLDGYFRDFLKGNFSRFKEKDIKSIPNDDRFGFLLDQLDSKKSFTIKDLYKVLAYQFHRFQKSNTMQKIRKSENSDYSYLRVTEPHKNGVPHFHILMYIPADKIDIVRATFEKFFPAPQNHKRLNNIGYDTNGFQIDIRNPVGYILKYILKSFRNVVEGKEPDYLDAWYSHYRIPRSIFSHTLLTQKDYLRIAILDDDWYYLSHLDVFKDKHLRFTFLHDKTNRHLYISKNYCAIYYINDLGFMRILKQYGTNTFNKSLISLNSLKFTTQKPYDFNILFLYDIKNPIIYRKSNIEKGCKVVYEFSNPQVKAYHTPVNKLDIYALLDLYHNFDFENYNELRYFNIKKELIKREFLHEDDFSLQYYSDFIDAFGSIGKNELYDDDFDVDFCNAFG